MRTSGCIEASARDAYALDAPAPYDLHECPEAWSEVDEAWWALVRGVDADEASLASLATTAPCPWSIAELTRLDPRSLAPEDALVYLEALQRHASWLTALEAQAMVAAAGAHSRERTIAVVDPTTQREASLVLVDEARDEIAAVLHRSPSTVHDQIEQARLLHGPMRRTLAALECGDLPTSQARALVQQALRLSGRLLATGQHPEDDSPSDRVERQAFIAGCEALEDRVLDKASTSTPGHVRSLASRAVAAIDRAGEEQRRQQSRARIDVQLLPDEDGLAVLLARMAAADAARVYAAISASASGESSLTAGQRRAAALVQLTCGARADTPGNSVGAVIDVVIDLPTLLGLQGTEGPAAPGMVMTQGSGGGLPVTVEAVRELLEDPHLGVVLRRLVTEPLSGHLLDRGRTTYDVPDGLRTFLTLRDQRCRFPGCSRSAARCQMDHALAWDAGGTTDRGNVGPLCVRHHQLKTHGNWAITESRPDGGCTWVSPSGRRFLHEPPALLEDRALHGQRGTPRSGTARAPDT